jgi:hypothetical protein
MPSNEILHSLFWFLETDELKKKQRGLLKGFKARNKRFANGSDSLILNSLRHWVVQ